VYAGEAAGHYIAPMTGGDHWSAIGGADALQAWGEFSPFRLLLAVDPTDSKPPGAHRDSSAWRRASDRGQTWTVAADAFGRCDKGICNVIGALALDPTNPRVILHGGSFGFARTTDGGQHWDILFGHFDCLQDTAPPARRSVASGATLYGVGSPYGLARSTDRWHELDAMAVEAKSSI